MACCFSGGWLLTMLFLRSAKYWRAQKRQCSKHTDASWDGSALRVTLTFSLSRMSPNSGRDIDHWFLQSSKMMMFNTVDSICTTITGWVSRGAFHLQWSYPGWAFKHRFLQALVPWWTFTVKLDVLVTNSGPNLFIYLFFKLAICALFVGKLFWKLSTHILTLCCMWNITKQRPSVISN